MRVGDRHCLNRFIMKDSFNLRRVAAIGLSLAVISALGASGLASEQFTLDTARVAADQGDPQAEFFLARHYADGLGVPRDDAKAVEYLRQAAGQGYAPAETGLGSCYAHGQGVKQDYGEAIQWYRKAASQGDPLAEYGLGYAYAQGKGVNKDIKAALNWWRKSAEQGQVYAQNALGQLYFRGEHPGDTNHINYAEAAQWLRKAAEQDYAPAMSTLGYMYLYGIGVEHDWSQALQWNRRAAEQGDAAAQDNLGQMYENGDAGLSLDLVQAYKWFWLSDQQGNLAGRHDVMEIELHHALTPEQITEAKRLAAEFHAQMHTNQPAAIREDQTDSVR
jgi:uncharacterized protein